MNSVLRCERGIALVLSLGVLLGISIPVVTVLSFSLSAYNSARITTGQMKAAALAEAGVNNALAVLATEGVDPLNPHLLPERSSTYEGDTVTWLGTLEAATATWTLRGTAQTRGPGSAGLRRTMSARVPVVPTLTQPLANPAWNYIYSTATGSSCDMTIEQSVQVASPLYVAGNLCLQNTATVTKGPLQVHGRLTLSQSGNAVGSAAAPISEAHVAGGCVWKSNPLHNPCSSVDSVFATAIDSTPATITAPLPHWDAWYLAASPGPYRPCATLNGTPPTFDNDQGSAYSPNPLFRNNSLGAVFNLTPSSSYLCRTAGGELSWDAVARTLTVKGTIFIDGSAGIDNGTVAAYTGQASLYLSGTLLVRNSKLCALVAPGGTDCDTAGWNPNQTLLVVAANGNGGQVPVGVGVQFVSSTFQGAVFATSAVSIDTTSNVIGPLIGSTILLGQSATTSFPPISIVPVGTPGNPVVYATLGTPGDYGA